MVTIVLGNVQDNVLVFVQEDVVVVVQDVLVLQLGLEHLDVVIVAMDVPMAV